MKATVLNPYNTTKSSQKELPIAQWVPSMSTDVTIKNSQTTLAQAFVCKYVTVDKYHVVIYILMLHSVFFYHFLLLICMYCIVYISCLPQFDKNLLRFGIFCIFITSLFVFISLFY